MLQCSVIIFAFDSLRSKVKTRLQTDPDQYKGFIDGLSTIAKDEGPSALLLGFRSTLVGKITTRYI